jgi:hypothetical protein
MIKYKVKDIVLCQVEIRKNGDKAILSRILGPEEQIKLESQQFEIIAINQIYPESLYHMHTILVEDNMIGWIIGKFHTQHYKINQSFYGKKFWDLTEEFMQPVLKI